MTQLCEPEFERFSKLSDAAYRSWYFLKKLFTGRYVKDRYREVKWFIQRGRRGYSDQDVWGIDTYLANWLPMALRQLSKTKHGIPIFALPDTPGLTENERFEQGEKIFDAALLEIIDGFAAYNKMHDLFMYDDELGPFPITCKPGQTETSRKAAVHERIDMEKKLIERDMQIFNIGMAAFVKYFRGLND